MFRDSNARGRLPNKTQEKNTGKSSDSRKIHPYGEPKPLLIITNFDPFDGLTDQNRSINFALIGLRVFVLRGAENGRFLYLATISPKAKIRKLHLALITLPGLNELK
jgi:hypothetical protein